MCVSLQLMKHHLKKPWANSAWHLRYFILVSYCVSVCVCVCVCVGGHGHVLVWLYPFSYIVCMHMCVSHVCAVMLCYNWLWDISLLFLISLWLRDLINLISAPPRLNPLWRPSLQVTAQFPANLCSLTWPWTALRILPWTRRWRRRQVASRALWRDSFGASKLEDLD